MRACNKQRSKIPLGTKGRTSILSYQEYVRPAELHSQSAEENCPTENVSSLRSVKGATLPCAAYAAIPCGLAVCKQHKMLFAASKFEKLNTEKLTVDWSQSAKSWRSFFIPIFQKSGQTEWKNRKPLNSFGLKRNEL